MTDTRSRSLHEALASDLSAQAEVALRSGCPRQAARLRDAAKRHSTIALRLAR